MLNKHLSDKWFKNYSEEIGKIEGLAENKSFRTAWQKVKTENKKVLAQWVKKHTSIEIQTDAMFDVRVKRIHGHKRRHLNHCTSSVYIIN